MFSLSSGSAGQSSEAFSISSCHQMIAAFLHVDFVADALQHDAVLDRRGLLQGLVDGLLQRQVLAATPATIGW